MVLVRALAVVVLGVLLTWADLGRAAQIGSSEVKGWSIKAYSSDKTGKFSNCAAFAEYRSGMTLAFQITQDFSWNMALFDAPGKSGRNRTFDVSFQIDRGEVHKMPARVDEDNFIFIALPDDVDLFDEFRSGALLRIQLFGRVSSFRLDGTSAMLKALLACAERYKEAVADNTPKGQARPSKQDKSSSGSTSISTGSGFFVDKDGSVLTNAHVVEGCEDATIIGYGKARIVTTDKTNDFALLKLTATAATDPVKFRKSPLQLGESIYVLGFPLAGQLDNGLNFTSGIVSSLAGPGNDTRALQLTAPIQEGNSGGPIVDAAGLLVGVTQAKLNEIAAVQAGGAFPQNVNFGIKSPMAVGFLRANSIDPQEVDPAGASTAVVIAKEGRGYTVQVKCSAK